MDFLLDYKSSDFGVDSSSRFLLKHVHTHTRTYTQNFTDAVYTVELYAFTVLDIRRPDSASVSVLPPGESF